MSEEAITLAWEGRKIGTAEVTLNQDGPTVELKNVQPIWLRTALMDSIIKQNAYSRRRHRG